MESFEYNELENNSHFTPEEPAEPVQEAPVDSVYHNTGTARRESPYANSPYEMNHPHQQVPPQPPKVKKPRKPIWKGAVSGLLVIALVVTGCSVTAAMVNRRWEVRSEAMAQKIDLLQQQIETATTAGGREVSIPTDGSAMTPSQLYSACVDSVVAISAKVTTTGIYGNTSTGSSAGSGFILTEDGYIVTNHHVVEDATSLKVTTHDGEEYDATIVGQDATNDLAVLKVEATGLPAVSLGSSRDLAIGDMVAAIGNPLGKLSATQTVGYVSGINREVATGGTTTISMIQTDAAINPGNSGGPLFNMYGQVVGITTAKYSGSTGSGASIEGIGFAIPIDDASALLGDLIDYGYVNSAYMGITVENVDEAAASRYGLPMGAYVVTVSDDGAAKRAGIQPKDIITDVGGHTITNITDLTRAMRSFKAGDTTTVTVVRGGSTLSLEITLDERPQEIPSQQETNPAPSSNPPGSYEEFFDFFRRYFGG